MDTVCDLTVQEEMKRLGGVGIHHRYTDIITLLQAVRCGPIAVSPSMSENGWLDRLCDSCDSAQFYNYALLPHFVIDVAHGDSRPALKLAEFLVNKGFSVVSGNIVTPNAAQRYFNIGVTWLRVGIGAGSVCTTREVSGVGIPQFTAIHSIHNSFFSKDVTILADGGMRSSGDIVKALAAGADAVMLGRLLAGAKEAPGERRQRSSWVVGESKVSKKYRGMASKGALSDAGKDLNIEGREEWIPEEGTLEDIMKKLCSGIRAGLAYCGARTISELQATARFVRIGRRWEGYQDG